MREYGRRQKGFSDGGGVALLLPWLWISKHDILGLLAYFGASSPFPSLPLSNSTAEFGILSFLENFAYLIIQFSLSISNFSIQILIEYRTNVQLLSPRCSINSLSNHTATITHQDTFLPKVIFRQGILIYPLTAQWGLLSET